MTNKLETKITRDEAVKAVERCLEPSKWNADLMVVTGATEMLSLGQSIGGAMFPDGAPMGAAIGMFELTLDKATELIDDEATCDIAWTTHILFGECLHIQHQCTHHPENPLDRITLILVSVRRTS